MIIDDQLSPALKEFILFHHHRPHTDDVLSMWSFNLRGYHVFHTAVRKAQDKELIAAGGLATYEQLIELFEEVIHFTLMEFGCMWVSSSNHVDQGKTPLMMIAEAPFAALKGQELFDILNRIMPLQAGLEMVDNHGNNALMLACCNNHEVFFQFFYANWKYLLFEAAPNFRWDIMNLKEKTMQDLLPTWTPSFNIRTMIENLKAIGVFYAQEEEIWGWRQVVFQRIHTECPNGMPRHEWCRRNAPALSSV